MLIYIGYYKFDLELEFFSFLFWFFGYKGFFKSYVQVCGLDFLWDDGLFYVWELFFVGVVIKVDVYFGVFYNFEVIIFSLGIILKVVQDWEVGFGWFLEQQLGVLDVK